MCALPDAYLKRPGPGGGEGRREERMEGCEGEKRREEGLKGKRMIEVIGEKKRL